MQRLGNLMIILVIYKTNISFNRGGRNFHRIKKETKLSMSTMTT